GSPNFFSDLGRIYLFERNKPEAVRTLKGHQGSVLSLVFTGDGQRPAVLASAAREWDGESYRKVVRLWDAERGTALGKEMRLPDPRSEAENPGLAVWHAGRDRVQVAVAWQDGSLRTWEVRDSTVRDLGEATDAPKNQTAVFLPDPADDARG